MLIGAPPHALSQGLVCVLFYTSGECAPIAQLYRLRVPRQTRICGLQPLCHETPDVHQPLDKRGGCGACVWRLLAARAYRVCVLCSGD